MFPKQEQQIRGRLFIIKTQSLNELNYYAGFGVIIPHATREPAFPVLRLPASPSRSPGMPRSSSPKCTTNALLATEFSEALSNVTTSSTILTVVCPNLLVTTFPKSPTCRFEEVGALCSF